MVLRVHQLEILVHIPEVAGYQGFHLQTQIGQRTLQFGIVLGLYLLLRGFGHNAVDNALGQLEAVAETLEGGILLLELLAVVVDIFQIGIDDDALVASWRWNLVYCMVSRGTNSSGIMPPPP